MTEKKNVVYLNKKLNLNLFILTCQIITELNLLTSTASVSHIYFDKILKSTLKVNSSSLIFITQLFSEYRNLMKFIFQCAEHTFSAIKSFISFHFK